MFNDTFPLSERTVPVTLVSGKGVEKEIDVNLSIAAMHIPITVHRKKGNIRREDTYRATIRDLEGLKLRQCVMIDLYRHLVASNYTRFNGRGGAKAAIKAAANGYADQGTLPGFENKTNDFNAAGEIVWNLLRHPEPEKIGYRVLGAILFALLDEGVLDYPRVNSLP